jgi:hypothetical protein
MTLGFGMPRQDPMLAGCVCTRSHTFLVLFCTRWSLCVVLARSFLTRSCHCVVQIYVFGGYDDPDTFSIATSTFIYDIASVGAGAMCDLS